MDKTYEILDHPADLKIKAFGKDLAEVFVNMAQAVAFQQLQIPNSKKQIPNQAEEIYIKSVDLNSLLVDWLSEILYRGEVNKKVYTDFEVVEFSENPPKIKAKIKGMPVESKNTDIKAATYHELEIKKAGGHWEGTVVFDI